MIADVYNKVVLTSLHSVSTIYTIFTISIHPVFVVFVTFLQCLNYFENTKGALKFRKGEGTKPPSASD